MMSSGEMELMVDNRQLPVGWEIKKLGEVCTLQRGFDLPKGQREEGDYLLISSSGCIDTHTEAKSFAPGVVTGRSGSIGSVFFITEDFWPLNTTLYVKDFHGNDPRFIFYLLNKFDLKRFASGVGVPTLNRNSVHSELVIIPSSIIEQKRIVAIADEAFEGIDRAIRNTEKNLSNARELFESYLNSIFTQKGDGWVKSKLNEVCEKITDGTHQTPKYFETGFVFLSSRNVTTGAINWDKVKYIDDAQHITMQKRVSPRLYDILLAKNGTTGVAALVDKDIDFDIYVSLALLRPLPVILPKFMLHFVNSPVAKEQFNKRLKGIGVPNLHLEEIREVTICYPQELRLQEGIIIKIDEMRSQILRLENIYRQKIAALKELKQSILQKAFTGELTAHKGEK
ncbi:restriction endonuclease subunit S [Dolichospermum sp. ST_sed1]|nr:restriction endonuclease subunit S [Dolichospermum sp. ST_sed1]MDD1426284.1 restriction endonuclease subunit S [Dolichospermum sp. ST_sed9]MDD1434588.1 restriction endonuclease subunit S [Dolichospermum sp. ST_sed6]MDD1442181.1 restriction endonuclease subunit S [Dolichospermum sp. ST_sed3]MDD1444572.1 restriction endonuclease subunit S [Dolichospermum sp. ST_sed8]MDD1458289.1 restriction endonuclease subunit S [Dolichospermum sp. ST_sed7]MDD1460116.1 restriction endonuclease subunit S [Do